jgi:hypothetical protein
MWRVGKALTIDDTAPLFDSFVYGIGDPGLVYNTGRPNELTYLARFSIEVIAKETGARTELLANHASMRKLLDDLAEAHREEFGRSDSRSLSVNLSGLGPARARA